MKLFFDTETTGLARFDLPSNHSLQPHVVSIVGNLTDDNLKEISVLDYIVKPIGFVIPSQMEAIHGISHSIALSKGAEPTKVFNEFQSLVNQATLLIGHNIKFDKVLVEREGINLSDRPSFCTMLSMTNICKIKKYNGYKWPKLQEAYFHCFGHKFEKAHSALADVRSCIAIYEWLHRSENQPKPTAPLSTTQNTLVCL